MTQEKLLDKLRKIQAHAESAKAIGSEEEAQAFASMLQKMLLEHELEMTDLEFQAEADEPILQQNITYPHERPFYKNGAVGPRSEWQEILAVLIARAHFCRLVILGNSNHYQLIGRKEHVAVAEYLIVTMTRAALKIAKRSSAEYRRERREADPWGRVFRESNFRSSFMNGFLRRLQQRFAEQRKQAEATTSTALVRLNKDESRVEDFMKGLGVQKAKALGQLDRGNNAEGYRRGVAAADRLNLTGNAMGSAGAAGTRKELKS